MAITRLKRKGRRNKQVASIRRTTMKQLTAKPVIANVDVEAIKEEFKSAAKAEKPAKEKAPKAEAKKEETPAAEVKKEAPKKKAAPKKAAKEESSEAEKEA